jgi:hypothetical protein
MNKWYDVGIKWSGIGMLGFLMCLATRNPMGIRLGAAMFVGMFVMGVVFSFMRYAEET